MVLIFLTVNELLVPRKPNFIKFNSLGGAVALASPGLLLVVFVRCFGPVFVVALLIVPTPMLSTVISAASPIRNQDSWISRCLTLPQSSTRTS